MTSVQGFGARKGIITLAGIRSSGIDRIAVTEWGLEEIPTGPS